MEIVVEEAGEICCGWVRAIVQVDVEGEREDVDD